MPSDADSAILSVSELNRAARAALEDSLPPLRVEGEISNLARPGSGHLYFSLKDPDAQVRCAMFRGANRRLGFAPEDGQQVLVHARVTLYEPRGSYQLIVEQMEPAGEGLLLRRLEQLKKQLAAAGLFDESHKQPLPHIPRQIGIITSPTGAAVRDIIQVLGRRFPGIPVILYPVQVQGERAKTDIAAAFKLAARRNECDLLIAGRGGGSLEDLWAFNEEVVARAIFDCPIPVISAVGHEVDVTIADFVADARAPTPSAAAELAVPDAAALMRGAASLGDRLRNGMLRRTRHQRVMLEHIGGRLARCHPGVVLRQHAQRIDELSMRMKAGISRSLQDSRLRVARSSGRLGQASPALRLQRAAAALAARIPRWQLRELFRIHPS